MKVILFGGNSPPFASLKKRREVDAYLITIKMAIIKFVYHALALDCLALVNSLRFELNVNRDSFCNAHLNDTVCMYPVMSLHMVTRMLRPSGASSFAYLLKLVAIPPGIVNGCASAAVPESV